MSNLPANFLAVEHGPLLAVGEFVGSRNATVNKTAEKVVNEANTVRKKSAEIHSASNMLPSEVAGRLDLLAKPYMAALRAHETALAQQRRSHESAAKNHLPVKRPEALHLHELLEDQALIARFTSLPINERTQIVSRAAVDPAGYERWIQALLRAHPILTDIPADQMQRMRDAAVEAFTPAFAEAQRQETAQLEFAQRALEVGMQVLHEQLPGAALDYAQMPDEPESAPGDIDPWSPEAKERAFANMDPAARADLLAAAGARRLSQVERDLQATRQ